MLLTKDNLLRFVQQHKYTTPTHVAKEFETTTTIASAALGELTNGGGLGSSHIKYGTTPYYYDMRQKECLVEIAKKSFSGTEQELFLKIQNEQIVSLNTLTIPQRAILNKLQDIYYELQIKKDEKTYTFLIWFLRDKDATYKQIQEALFGNSNANSNNNNANSSKSSSSKNTASAAVKKSSPTSSNQNNSNQSNSSNASNSNSNTNSYQNSQEQTSHSNPFSNLYSSNQSQKQSPNTSNNNNNNNDINSSSQKSSPNSNQNSNKTSQSNSNETTNSNIGQTNSNCDKYLYENGFTILEKEKHSLGFLYKVTTPLNEFTLNVDALYIDQKKIQLKEIIDFYTSSMRPKMIFHSNLPKKIEQSVKEFENCILIEIKN